MSDLETYINLVQSALIKGEPTVLTFSKPRQKEGFLSAKLHSILLQGSLTFKLERFTKTQAFTEILPAADLKENLHQVLAEQFYFSEMITNNGKFTLLQSKKGGAKLLKSKAQTKLKHKTAINHAKEYTIPETAPFLQSLGLASSEGKIHSTAQKKFRQINRFVELVDHFLDPEEKELIIADMGCGKGYLTFALHDYLLRKGKQCLTTGIDIRADLVEQGNRAAKELGLEGLKFEQGSIADFEGTGYNTIIALHACDIATDMALFAGITAGAKYIITSPCCHKQIRQQITLKNPITHHGILLERQAELVTDAMRVLLLEYMGYKTKIIEFISSEHTSKNLLILAEKSKKNPKKLEEFSLLKTQYGIKYHHLERLLGLV